MIVACIAAVALGGPCAASPVDEPSEQLARLGLARVGASGVWVVAEELELRARITAAPGIHRRILAAQKQLNDVIHQNRRQWAAASRSAVPLASSLNPALAPDRLGGQEPVRQRLIQLIDDTGQLAIAVTRVSALVARFEQHYARLAANPDVAAALEQLGSEHRLGPVKDYASDLRTLSADASRLIHTPWTPAYLVAGRVRFAMIMNGEVQVTFTWLNESSAALIPASVVETAGIAIPDDAVHRAIQIGNRRFEARAFRIRRLQAGNCTLDDVEALALPPEAEDLGALIGPQSFGPWSVHAQPAQLRLFFERSPGGTPEAPPVTEVRRRNPGRSLREDSASGDASDEQLDCAGHGSCETYALWE